MLHPKVIILMGTYNGQHYLAEQLDSICTQTYKHWEIWVSDDGSSDNTSQILKAYQTRLGKDVLRIFSGPRKGFAANFLSLVCNKDLAGSYFAYSDQDDIWQPTKLQQAVDWLNTVPEELPALYCGRTKLVDEHGKTIGYSPLFKKQPGFLNALIQSIGGGNTMVFNNIALDLLREAGEAINIVAHDWWTYMVVAGAGGAVFYDPHPTLDYRQHGNNQIGGNVGWSARFGRLLLMFKGRFKTWNDLNFKALLSIKHRLTDDNRRVLMDVIDARGRGLVSRVVKLKRLGLYRQTFSGNVGLFAAVFLKKL